MEKTQSEIEVIKERKIAHGVVQLRSDNILVFRPDLSTFKSYNVTVLEDLRKNFVEMVDGVPRPYMCDNRHVSILVNREEKEYMNNHFCEFGTHFGMISHSPIVRILFNRFKTVFNPGFDLRVFKTEEDTINWLLEQSKET